MALSRTRQCLAACTRGPQTGVLGGRRDGGQQGVARGHGSIRVPQFLTNLYSAPGGTSPKGTIMGVLTMVTARMLPSVPFNGEGWEQAKRLTARD